MALDPQLAKFRAPGTKILTTVQEQIPVIEAPSGARLLVINVRKGPVNKPIFVQTWTEFKRYFGNISIAEERKGEFGRRSAYYMLQVTPIFVLNLRAFDDALDLAGTVELSTDSSVANASAATKAFSKLFNKQQFWNIDPKKLVESTNEDKMLMFGNVGTSNLSVFVRKSRNVRTSLTFDRWYKNLGRTMPAFVYPEDKVADWYVDVMIFDNSFTADSNSNAVYGYLFDSNGNVRNEVENELGLTVDALEQLAAIPESGYVATITGSLIPGFINETGDNNDVVSLINANVEQYGLIAKVNDDIFDDAEIWSKGNSIASNGYKQPIVVDFLGHGLLNTNSAGNFDETKYATYSSVSNASYNYDLSIKTGNAYASRGNVATSAEIDEVQLDADTTLMKYTGVRFPANIEVSGSNTTVSLAGKKQ